MEIIKLVLAAVAEYGGRGDCAGVFSTTNFGVALARRYDIAKIPDDEYCEAVLKKVEFIEPIWGSDSHWKVREL